MLIHNKQSGQSDKRKFYLVPKRRFELLHIAALEPETSVSTNSTTSAFLFKNSLILVLFRHTVPSITIPFALKLAAGCVVRNFSTAS